MDNDAFQPSLVLRPSAGGRAGSVFVTVLTGGLGVFMTAMAGLLLFGGDIGIALFLAAIAAFIWVLFFYLLPDTRSKLGWRVGFGKDAVALDLPGGRSFTHHLGPVHRRVRYDEIEAIETRLEAYVSLGMVNMQRVFGLRLKSGDLVILGEDRALETALATALMTKVVLEIFKRAAPDVRDFGMAKGKGGFLCVLFTAPPPWDAASLPEEEQVALLRRARMTGDAAQGAALGALLTRG